MTLPSQAASYRCGRLGKNRVFLLRNSKACRKYPKITCFAKMTYELQCWLASWTENNQILFSTHDLQQQRNTYIYIYIHTPTISKHCTAMPNHFTTVAHWEQTTKQTNQSKPKQQIANQHEQKQTTNPNKAKQQRTKQDERTDDDKPKSKQNNKKHKTLNSTQTSNKTKQSPGLPTSQEVPKLSTNVLRCAQSGPPRRRTSAVRSGRTCWSAGAPGALWREYGVFFNKKGGQSGGGTKWERKLKKTEVPKWSLLLDESGLFSLELRTPKRHRSIHSSGKMDLHLVGLSECAEGME